MQSKKRNRKTKKINVKKIGIFVIIFLLIGIFLLQKRDTLSFLEKIVRDIFLMPLNITNSIVVSNSEVSNIDNNILQIENDELRKEIEELKNVVKINEMFSDKVVVTANVISRNISFFFDTITINKGSSSGITEGMAVVSGNGLIGKTKYVSNYYSEVELLTNENMAKVSVKLNTDNNFIYGLLSGYNKDNNVYYIEGISKRTEVPIGANVTTTGMGDIFPSGILIGTVSSINTDHFDLSKKLEVTPSVNINDFTVVSVLKRNVNS